MTTRIQFWREINANGRAAHAVLKTFVAPTGIPEDIALQDAKREFCAAMRVTRWNLRAHGYDVSCDGDGTPKVTH